MADWLPCRTIAEAHLYLDLLGWPREGRTHRLEEHHGVWVAVYTAVVDGRLQALSFRAPDDPAAYRDAFGGPTPSSLIDPGQFVAHAARLASSLPLDPEDVDPAWRGAGARRLEIAARCVDEALKFIPSLADRVPPDAFFTEEGRAVRAAEPGRFERDRLQAVAASFRETANHYAAVPEAAIRPILRPADWDVGDRAVSRRLLPLEGTPWVAYAWDTHPLRAYVGPVMQDRVGWTAEELHDAAVARIERQPPPVRVHDLALPGDPPLKVAVVEGEYAAEQVLVPSFLRDLQRDLGGPIGVAVPYRGLLLATGLSDATRGALQTLADRFFAEPRGEAITSWVFLVAHDGTLEGWIRPR